MGQHDRFSFRTATEIASYDAARWLAPPPAVPLTALTRDGLGLLVQRGISTASAPVQEVLVPPLAGQAVLLVVPGAGADFEATIDGAFCRSDRRAWTTIFLPAGSESRWTSWNSLRDVVHLHVPDGFLAKVAGERAAVPDGLLWTHRPDFEPIIRALFQDSGGDMGDLVVESYATLLLSRLLADTRQDRDRPAAGGLAAWQLRRTVEHIRERAGESISLRELAAIADLSPFHFARAFRQSTGMPPHRFQTHVRIERAKQLLASNGLSIGQIAASLGYDSPQSLARTFRREVGLTPSAFRRLALD